MANQKYEAFLHIAETGSFKQAAHDLGYTQAGISYLISSMERELGIPLFVRRLRRRAPYQRRRRACCPGSATSATTSVSWLDALPS